MPKRETKSYSKNLESIKGMNRMSKITNLSQYIEAIKKYDASFETTVFYRGQG